MSNRPQASLSARQIAASYATNDRQWCDAMNGIPFIGGRIPTDAKCIGICTWPNGNGETWHYQYDGFQVGADSIGRIVSFFRIPKF